MSETIIPVMDDPLGKYWTQPSDIRSVPMDDTHVILTQQQIRELSNYDRSLPTGVYPGKCWLRRESTKTYLVWYGAEQPDHCCPIFFREVLELTDA